MKDEEQQLRDFVFSDRFMETPAQENNFIARYLFRPRQTRNWIGQ